MQTEHILLDMLANLSPVLNEEARVETRLGLVETEKSCP